VGANAMEANIIETAEAPITSTDEEESKKENYLPKTIIVKSITVLD
jgi:hypothetical protein